MNKRIKKKKAKQARQQELEQLEQELAKPSPEQLVDIQNAISQVFYEFERIFQNPEQVLQYLYVIGIGLENAFNNMAIAFSRLAEEMRKWADAIQQRR